MNEYEIGKDITELKLKIMELNAMMMEITKLIDHNLSLHKLEQVK